MSRSTFTRRACAAMVIVSLPALAGIAVGSGGQVQVPTTVNDFFQPGTQPDPVGIAPILQAWSCTSCHSNYLEPDDAEPYDAWIQSMMAQAVRDPIWQAAVTIANQDAAGAGETCIRCHAPNAWVMGRSTGGDLDALLPEDYEGINCNFCHRLVDPVLSGGSAPEDVAIIGDLQMAGLDFSQPGQGRFVLDPDDARRGPFFDVPYNFHNPVPIIPSNFHRKSELCASCHDVSTPTYTRQPDGTYAPNMLDAAHPTGDPYDMFPEQRTYSEWLYSAFADGGVVFPDGRFGGNLTAILPNAVPVSTCQDCHMPDAFTGGCVFWEQEPFFAREDMPRHDLHGANTWVQGAVLDEYGEFESGLTEDAVQSARAKAIAMLEAASDTELVQVGEELSVRVINQSGHKLPTGYPEGRRMWLNVRFLDDADNPVAEHGAYDLGTATLDEQSTKVYHAEQGLDAAAAALTGLPEGTKFHLALSNKVYYDNRIPPIGWTNAEYEASGAAPVGVTYADGQHWDDTLFPIPPCATKAEVTLYYQTTSRAYAEFLRDTVSDPMNDRGQNAYDRWVARGKSEPVAMDVVVIDTLVPPVNGDTNGDLVVDVTDLVNVILAWGACDPPCPADGNCDGVVDVTDLVNVILNWG